MIDRVLQLAHFDDLDTDLLPRSVSPALVHRTAVPLADVLVDLVGIALD